VAHLGVGSGEASAACGVVGVGVEQGRALGAGVLAVALHDPALDPFVGDVAGEGGCLVAGGRRRWLG